MSSFSGGGGGGGYLAGSPEPGQRSRSQPVQGGGGASNEPPHQRYSNLIYDSDVFLTKLREFKPQSLGCLEARRKSSSTLIFPNPQQACIGPPKCPRYPHDVKPTPGYWIECHGPGQLGQGSKQQLSAQSPKSGTPEPQTGGASELSVVFISGDRTGSSRGSSISPGAKPAMSSSPTAEHISSAFSHSHDYEPSDAHQAMETSDTERDREYLGSLKQEKEEMEHQQEQQDEEEEEVSIDLPSSGRATAGSQAAQPATATGTTSARSPDESAATAAQIPASGAPTAAKPMQFKSEEAGQQQQQQPFSPFGQPHFGPGSASSSPDMSPSALCFHQYGTRSRALVSLASQQQQQLLAAQRQQQPQQQQQAGSKNISELRRRLGKRTVTRDDIDLHKPRKTTPNITITEPINQQATAILQQQPSLLSGRSKRGGGGGGFARQPTRQTSQSAATSPAAAARAAAAAAAATASLYQRADSIEQQQQPQTSVFHHPSLRYSSYQQQPDLIKFHVSDHEPMILDDSSDGSDIMMRPGSAGSGTLDFKPHRQQQHRPSIIREDSDDQQSGGSVSDILERDFYCGLATKTFQKKPYQQVYHLHQQQQQQQQQLLLSSSSSQQLLQQQQQQQQQQANIDQFKDGSLELISFEEENYEKHYYGREHWNYFTNDELLGPVMLSLKQEVNNQRDHFHVLLRTVSYTLHGTIPASTICADRYDREAIVRELSEIAKLKPPLMLGQLPSTPDELLKLDHIFIKTELKVGVIYIKAGQAESEEAILGNKEESPLFSEFLELLGDRITLKGFDRYKGGLDTVHNLTGTESVYTMWRNIEIMFHVSTMLPHEENDPQKLQKKRHIGNDIVCVAFIESDDILFWPGCIKSYFLHTFITVRTSPKPVKEGEKRKYYVSCVCRNEVQYAFKPYLIEQDVFYKSDYFREWLLVKIVNGERASYSAPKFARMQDRTRSQLLEDIITNLANHLVTGQIPKPYRRGSWRPLGHARASSPLEDSMKDYFEDYDQLAKDFCSAFCGPSKTMLCDVVFKVKDRDGTFKLVHGVRAIMAIRSRTFLEMLYGFVPPGTGPSSLTHQPNLRAIEMKALSGESSSGAGGTSTGAGGSGAVKELEQTAKTLLAKRGSVGTDSAKKSAEKERRQSMLPNLSKSISQKPNYLTVPSTSSGVTGSGGSGTGGMIKNAFNRLVSGNWSGWSGSIKGYKGDMMHIKVDQNKTKVDLNSLAICKEIAKIDADKLSQREFEIKEFDYETFQQTIEYIHNGQCKLSYDTIPGLICAAEHYDLPDLLHACFHHANTHMKLSAAPKMMNSLHQSACFYVTAMQLLDSIYEYIDPIGNEFFTKINYFELYESVLSTLLARKTLQVSELKKFQVMNDWTRHQIKIKQEHKLQQLQHQHQHQRHMQLQRQLSIEPLDQEAREKEREFEIQKEREREKELAQVCNPEDTEAEYRNLMVRLNKEVNIKLDKISNEDLVKIVLPTRVFSNEKVFDVMADESRNDY